MSYTPKKQVQDSIALIESDILEIRRLMAEALDRLEKLKKIAKEDQQTTVDAIQRKNEDDFDMVGIRAWISMKEFNVRLAKTDTGIQIEVFKLGNEIGKAIESIDVEDDTYYVFLTCENPEFSNDVMYRGLSKEEAMAITEDPESSSDTAKSALARKMTETKGRWFLAFEKE